MHVLHSTALGHNSARRAVFVSSFSTLLILSVLALLPVVPVSVLARGFTEVPSTVACELRLPLLVSSVHTRCVTALCW